MQMTYETMMSFAESWIAAWNRRDIEAILAHFAEKSSVREPSGPPVRGTSGAPKQRRVGGLLERGA